MTYRHSAGQPVYAPNSYGGPRAAGNGSEPTWAVEAGEIGRYAYEQHADDDDFVQARALYGEVMDETDRKHLLLNISAHVRDGVTGDVQKRVVEYWSQVDAGLGARIASALA
jgi:catalase